MIFTPEYCFIQGLSQMKLLLVGKSSNGLILPIFKVASKQEYASVINKHFICTICLIARQTKIFLLLTS